MNLNMDSRKELVFKRMVLEYISSARPVGSKMVAQRSMLGLSPATIRNYFSEFEKLGLVEKPHTSAGRVPTDSGFRYYVDHLARTGLLDRERVSGIRKILESGGPDRENFTRQTPRIISRLSRLIGILTGPEMKESRLREIHFLRLDPGRILAIFIFLDEMIENQILKNQESLSGPDLQRLSAYLNRISRGKTLLEVRNYLLEQLKSQGRRQSQEMRKLWELSEQIFNTSMSGGVSIEGASNLANCPEFSDPDKYEELLGMLEDQRVLVELLDQSLKNSGVRVVIGNEHPFPAMRGLALVCQSYCGREGKPIGSVGIIGPKRMDYEKTISLVSSVAGAITEYMRLH
jgi:heat-inducible transcriptional repressor